MTRLFALIAGLLLSLTLQAADTYSFGVLSQRSPVLTAEYWNPILDYAGKKAGVNLLLRVARTGPESNAAIARGEYDFTYSNHLFKPANLAQDYQVILRSRETAIKGQIVTLAGSAVGRLADLQGLEVGFPSRAAFVGYAVPMDHLIRSGIAVIPVFGGNQEGIIGQLQAGKIMAAAVNDQVIKAYALREGLRYRVLWESESYDNIPIAVHPRVDKSVVESVRRALAGMNDDPAGRKVLEASAAVIRQKPPYGFVPGNQKDYRNYLDFYRNTVVKDLE